MEVSVSALGSGGLNTETSENGLYHTLDLLEDPYLNGGFVRVADR